MPINQEVAMHPRKKVVGLDLMRQIRQTRIVNGMRVVLISGSFDLVHGGHLEALVEARKEGDFLVVGINSDAFVKRLKGPCRPVRGEADRAFLIAGFGIVDLVTIFDCDYELIRAVKPDVYVISKNAAIVISDDPKRIEVLNSIGATIVEKPYSTIDSTTAIIKRSVERSQAYG